MMFAKNLPGPETLRDAHHDTKTITALVSLRRDMVNAVRVIQPETLLALARQNFPGDSDQEAVRCSGELS